MGVLHLARDVGGGVPARVAEHHEHEARAEGGEEVRVRQLGEARRDVREVLERAVAEGEGDEVFTHACDLDDTTFGKQTIFDFARHRRIEHYGAIASQTGVQLPD